MTIALYSLAFCVLLQIIGFSFWLGKLSQSVKDLVDNLKKQNGRVGKLEENESSCSREFEHRVSKVETNQQNTMDRLDKIEAIPYVEKRV